MLKSLSLAVITVFSASLIYASDQVSNSRTFYDSVKSLIDPVLYLSPSGVYPKDMMAKPLAPSVATSATNQSFADLFEVAYSGSAFWSGIRNVMCHNGYAFLAVQNGLMIADVANPNDPTIISRTFLQNGHCSDVAVQGDLAYVTSEGRQSNGGFIGALYIIDITDMSNPTVLSMTGGMEAGASSISVSGDWVYVGAGHALLAIDVSDPYNPNIEVELPIENTSYGQVLWQDHIYLANLTEVQIYDVTDRAAPTWVASLGIPRFAIDVDVCNGALVIAGLDLLWPAQKSAVYFADISDPEHPVLSNSVLVDYAVTMVSADSNIVAVGTETGIYILEVESPDSCAMTGYYPAPGDTYCVEVSGNCVFAGTWDELIGPSLPDCDTCTCSPLPDTSLIRRGDFQVIDISDPTTPCATGVLRMPMTIIDVAVTDQYAYSISNEFSRLGVADISSPNTIEEIREFSTGTGAGGMSILDNLLCLAAGTNGIILYSLIDPENPIRLSSMDGLGIVTGVHLEDTILYAVNLEGWLLTLDISNLSHPELRGYLEIGSAVYGVTTDANLAYVATIGGLYIVDVADVAAPQLISRLEETNSISDVEVNGGLAITSSGTVDVSDPSNPRLLDCFMDDLCGRYWRLDVNWDRMEVALNNGWDGVLLYDVSDPENLTIKCSYNSPGSGCSVAMNDEYLLLADYWSLIRLTLPIPTGIDDPNEPASLPSEFRLEQNYPNPFNPVTKIQFSLPTRSHVSISIYNILGEKVRHLLDRELSAGEHEIFWDGCDDNGSPLATGVYFYRLETADFVETKKMLLLK